MVLCNIEISWRGDYELSFEEQSAHEFFVDQVKHQLQKLLEQYSWPKHVLYINLYYYPELLTFKVKDSQGLNDRINGCISDNFKLKKYFTQ
jgi:hypothetical protein